MSFLRSILGHPLTMGMDPDAAETTNRRRRIIKGNKFLKRLYLEWYGKIISYLPGRGGGVLELGAGGGFLREMVEGVIASDIMPVEGIDLVANAENLPFKDSSLEAVVMVNVLHHIPNLDNFFTEAARALTPGGRIIMIEPWRTVWSSFVYRRLHPEPFDADSKEWTLPSGGGPLSGANGALPWIVFDRDKVVFEARHASLKILEKRVFMPFSYLLSGGVSMRQLCPGFLYPAARFAERLLDERAGMFALLVVENNKPEGLW